MRFWLDEDCRNAFLGQVDRKDLPNVRLTCLDFGAKAAPFLFDEVEVTFKPSSFTRPARMAALERIGDHVKTLSFNLPHGPSTFLPPLIDPWTGEERNFDYSPQVSKPPTLIGKVKQPKYGSWEVTELLVKQYPPLFHAATDVPSFVRTLSAMPNLSHLKISCPGQEPALRYRRSTVDYALISLRIAVERAPLHSLETLSLLSVHPSSVFYLMPSQDFGASHRSPRRWAQIKKLAVEMDGHAPCPKTLGPRNEHLRLLHGYLRMFSHSLTRLSFRWVGDKGPSPLSLHSEPCLQPQPPPVPPKTANLPLTPLPSPPKTSSSFPPPGRQCHHRPSPLPPHPYLHNAAANLPRPPPTPLTMPRLTSLMVENCTIDARQISALITRHRRSLTDFEFEDITLRSGDWDEALAPLTRMTGGDGWKGKAVEVMDVPIVMMGAQPEPQLAFSPPPRPSAPTPGAQRAALLGGGTRKAVVVVDEPVMGKLGGGGGTVVRKSCAVHTRADGQVKSAWLTKRAARAKEQLWGCEGGMKRFWGASVFSKW